MIKLKNLQTNVALAPFSTFKIGGAADYFIIAKSKEELKEAYIAAKKASLPLFVLGGGSNVIFSDEGFRGIIIKNEAKKLEVEGTLIKAESGVLWAQITQIALENNLQGVEQLMGLPGTLGGAVRGNAGAHGVEMKDILKNALILDEDTWQEKLVEANYFNFGYRESVLKENPQLVLELTIELKPNRGQVDDLRETMKKLLFERREKQPTGQNAGSFFKNPSVGQSAGRLIDSAGLKGFKIGNAQISPMHGNFFMNLGGATQQEVLQLAKKAQDEVLKSAGIKLEQEVLMLNAMGNSLRVS